MSMKDAKPWFDYDYVILNAHPHVYRVEVVPVGVIVHCRTAGYLEGKFAEVDDDLLARSIRAHRLICEGTNEEDPISRLAPSERFHWLSAPRSAVVQPTAVHGGRSQDLKATLQALYERHVAPPA